MAHKKSSELSEILKQAKIDVSVGSMYSHYKNPDLLYKVTQIAVLEASDEPCVIYQAQYGPRFSFVRPVSSWLDKVEWQNQTVPRFTKV
jgi:hypothetical protein